MYYGALQISKDVDFLVDSDVENLSRLMGALDELQADRIAVPSFSKEYLDKGHAVHFRCKIPEAKDLRVDVMSKLRAMPSFDKLFQNREEVQLPSGEIVALMGRFDLVQAKKTQHEKDWPVISLLSELHYLNFRDAPNTERLDSGSMSLEAKLACWSFQKNFLLWLQMLLKSVL